MTWLFIGHRQLVIRLLSIVGSTASLVGLVSVFAPKPSEWQQFPIILIAAALVCTGLLIYLEIKSEAFKRVYDIGDKAKIRDYMYEWLSKGGRVAIWTRDMSWVNDDEMRQLLLKKAKAKELIICLPQGIQLTEELSEEGALICAYNSLENAPGSRFTIVNYGQDGSRVAVGRREGDLHIIEEFSAGDHPAFYMARDLVRLAQSTVQEQNDGQNHN